MDAGAFVQEGQLLAKLEDRDAQLRLQAALASEQQAEASLRQAESHIGLVQGGKFDANNVPEVLSAKASYDSAVAQAKMSEADAQRYDALIKTGDVSQSAYDKARTQADTAKEQTNSARQLYEASLNSARQSFQGVINAQASLAGARAQTAIARKAVEDTIIKAPFTGYISSRPVAVGQYVALTAKIATLVRVTPLKLELQVQESNAPQLKIGADVEASVPGYPGRTFHGTVTSINPTVDSNSRTVSVEARVREPGPGAEARHVRHGAHSVERQQHGNLFATRQHSHRSQHQLVSGFLHSRRQGAGGRGAAGRGGRRHDPDSVGHHRGFRGRHQPSSGFVRWRARGYRRTGRHWRHTKDSGSESRSHGSVFLTEPRPCCGSCRKESRSMHKLAELCVKRPVFATMLIVALMAVGGFSFFTLGVDLLPKIDLPTVSVSVSNPGASAEEVETDITKRVEDSVNTISGIEGINSTSVEGASTVIIQLRTR